MKRVDELFSSRVQLLYPAGHPDSTICILLHMSTAASFYFSNIRLSTVENLSDYNYML